MKKVILALVLLVTVACQQDKIAYVDYTKLLNDYQEKVDIEAKFKVKLEAMNKKRDSLGQMIQLEAQAIQTKNASQKTKQDEMTVLQQKSQFLGQQLQQEEQLLQQEGRTETDTLISKVKKEVSDYGKANTYTYILGGGEGGTVLYGDETKDITDAVLKILNDKYKKN